MKIDYNDLVQLEGDDRWYRVLGLSNWSPTVPLEATVVEHDTGDIHVPQQRIQTSQIVKRRRWVKGKR